MKSQRFFVVLTAAVMVSVTLLILLYFQDSGLAAVSNTAALIGFGVAVLAALAALGTQLSISTTRKALRETFIERWREIDTMLAHEVRYSGAPSPDRDQPRLRTALHQRFRSLLSGHEESDRVVAHAEEAAMKLLTRRESLLAGARTPRPEVLERWLDETDLVERVLFGSTVRTADMSPAHKAGDRGDEQGLVEVID
jgi:hypothetical protein